jgi:hypothetical protein
VAHYSPEINELIVTEIADIEKKGSTSDTCRLQITKDNIDLYFNDLLDYLENYDYNSL